MAGSGFGRVDMRLDGSLEDFGLPDVLQLLAQTGKTGALHLSGASERRGVIRVGGGNIDGASADVRRQSLARRLIGGGLIGDDVLAAAAEDVASGAPSLVRALLDRAALPQDEVVRVASDQATDAVCELLRWSAGTFAFLIGESDPEALGLALRAEDLVAEGQRRMQVWPTLTSHIPSPDSVLRLVPAPAFDPSCTREEWGMLAMVDGSRTVSEIVALLGRSDFAVAGALAALVERGLLTVIEPGAGLADLQRRQAIIAAVEAGEPAPPAAAPTPPTPPAPPAPTQAPAAPPVPAADVPQSRGETTIPAAPSQPITAGSTALDIAVAPATAVQPEPAAVPDTDAAVRGLDSAVTKSLVLRLIAGVRGL
jgi:hypothetical protein